jgi:hypothetical protein
MHVGPSSPLHIFPAHLGALLRCVEVADQPEKADLPAPERPGGPDRPLYAVSPIGKIGPVDREPPPLPVEHVRAMNWFHVTPLGTLLDVLA